METQAQENKRRAASPSSQLPIGKETNEEKKKCGAESLWEKDGPGGAHDFNASTQDTKEHDCWGQIHPGFQSEFENSQDYTEKACLKRHKIK